MTISPRFSTYVAPPELVAHAVYTLLLLRHALRSSGTAAAAGLSGVVSGWDYDLGGEFGHDGA